MMGKYECNHCNLQLLWHQEWKKCGVIFVPMWSLPYGWRLVFRLSLHQGWRQATFDKLQSYLDRTGHRWVRNSSGFRSDAAESWCFSGTRTNSWEPESSRFHLEAGCLLKWNASIFRCKSAMVWSAKTHFSDRSLLSSTSLKFSITWNIPRCLSSSTWWSHRSSWTLPIWRSMRTNPAKPASKQERSACAEGSPGANQPCFNVDYRRDWKRLEEWK